MTNPIIFYHSADLDGKCSAAIALFYEKHVWNRDCELYGINYGQAFPWDKVAERRLVYMLDFSLEPFEDMVRLATTSDLMWIDHHETAVDALKKHGEHQLPGAIRLEIGKAGCELTWEVCSPEPMPKAVRLLGRYDVWDEKCADPTWQRILEFQYGMRLEETEPTSRLWPDLFADNIAVSSIISTGGAILRYETKQNEIAMSALCYEAEFEGLRALIANRGPANSRLFDSQWDPEKHDIMISFYWAKRGMWKVSLYTAKDDVNCAKIAEKYKGGGHAKAAGFVWYKELPFPMHKPSVPVTIPSTCT